METLDIERNPGERETCRYLPRDPKESDGNLRFYAEIKGKWRVVTLEAVRPHGQGFVNDSGDRVPTPFSDSPPKDIVPCRLCPPSCFADQAEAMQKHPDDWQECLWVKPEQEQENGILRNILTRLRQAALAVRCGQDFPFLPAYQTNIPAEYGKRRLVAADSFQREYCDRIANITLADLKQGRWQNKYFYVRDAFLVAEWVQRKRINTTQIDFDAKTCFAWMSSHDWDNNRPLKIFNGYESQELQDNWEPYFQRVVDKVLSAHYGNDYLIMFRYRRSIFESLLAQVRYKATFQNTCVIFLTNLWSRTPTAQERKEIEEGHQKTLFLKSPRINNEGLRRRYRIEYAGGITWAIDFDKHPTFNLHSKKGGLYLKLLFRTPRPADSAYTIIQLLGMLNPTAEQQMSEKQACTLGLTIHTGYAGTPMTSTQNPDRLNRITARQYNNIREHLDEQIGIARANGNNQLANQYREQMAQLGEWYAKQNFTEKGKQKTYFDSMKKLIRDIKTRLRKEKQPGGIALAQHLDHYLHFERLKIWYWPPPDTNIRWEF